MEDLEDPASTGRPGTGRWHLRDGTVHLPTIDEKISIENLSFAYGRRRPSSDVSVAIPAGSSAAFVGPTGAGKTTLVNMIPRFYDPAAGVVQASTAATSASFPLPDLRSRIALVSQETPVQRHRSRQHRARQAWSDRR